MATIVEQRWRASHTGNTRHAGTAARWARNARRTARAADRARADYVLTPANTSRNLTAWERLYGIEVPRPANSVPLPVIWA